jgi:2-hydroxy-6-oxonona-2,4-dienedioate hydrolase
MNYSVQEQKGFKFIESNPDCSDTLLLLHGLFGALSNFKGIIDEFGSKYNVVVPILPIYELPLPVAGLGGLVDHLEKFLKFKQYQKLHLLGNSLGGHLALLYVLRHQDAISSLTLTGSSGLFESAMGSSFPKRGNYEYIENKTRETFFDPAVATKELVDEVFDIVNDKGKALRVIITAKSAVRHNLSDKLFKIDIPVLLVWGRQDNVTPPFVAEKFHELLSNSELVFIDKCGHAPMMENPDAFNIILNKFLSKVN